MLSNLRTERWKYSTLLLYMCTCHACCEGVYLHIIDTKTFRSLLSPSSVPTDPFHCAQLGKCSNQYVHLANHAHHILSRFLKKVHILRFVALWLFINFHHTELDCTGNNLGKRQQEDPRVDGSMESSKIWKCSRWRIGRISLQIERTLESTQIPTQRESVNSVITYPYVVSTRHIVTLRLTREIICDFGHDFRNKEMWNKNDSCKILRLDQLPSGWTLSSAAKIRNISFREDGQLYRHVGISARLQVR